MTRRALAPLALGAALLAAAACRRESRAPVLQAPAAASKLDVPVRVSPLQPGGALLPAITAGNYPYEGNAQAISDGQRLFDWYNCSGCHGHGGGSIGPSFMKDIFVYGRDPANIHASIVEGRPNGMPSWGGHIPDDDIWKLVAYIRTMYPGKPIGEPPGPREDHLQSGAGRESH